MSLNQVMPWYWFNTRQKVKVASFIFKGLHFVRTLQGKSDWMIVKRNGINLKLNLSEGIDLALFLGVYEPHTFGALKHLIKKGDTVLDVGANIGCYTFLMAQQVEETGKVYAFEPTQFAYQRLSDNLRLNAHLKDIIRLNQYYLTDDTHQEGKVEFYSSWSLNGNGDKHYLHFGKKKEATGAVAETLDAFANKNLSCLNFIKIDVDGFECKVFRGGLKCLERYKPVIITEICPYALEENGDSLSELLSIFKKLGYRLFLEKSLKEIAPTESRLLSVIPHQGSINVILSKDDLETQN